MKVSRNMLMHSIVYGSRSRRELAEGGHVVPNIRKETYMCAHMFTKKGIIRETLLLFQGSMLGSVFWGPTSLYYYSTYCTARMWPGDNFGREWQASQFRCCTVQYCAALIHACIKARRGRHDPRWWSCTYCTVSYNQTNNNRCWYLLLICFALYHSS